MYLARFGVAALTATLLLNTLGAQDRGPLTNQRVCELLADGVSTQEVIRVIMSAKEIDFTLQPAYIDAMMKAGVTDEVIRAMAAREHSAPVQKVDSKGQVVTVRQDYSPVPTRTSVAGIIPQPDAAPPEGADLVGNLKMRDKTSPNLQTGKSRVFVQGSNDAWSFAGGRYGGGGSHPQTVELMKTFGESCPNLTVTNNPEDAEYTVIFQRESSKVWRRDNKMVVFNRAGDMVYSASTRALGNAVRGFCKGKAHPTNDATTDGGRSVK